MKRISRITALLATGALLFSGFMMSCSHSSSDDGEPENVPSAEPSGTPEEDSSSSLYRLNATSDCDFAEDGTITDFGTGDSTDASGGVFLYYPTAINLESDTAEISATVKVNSTDGRVGLGFIDIYGGKVDSSVLETASQKIRYQTAGSGNGSGWSNADGLTSNACTVGTTYIWKASVSEKKILFEIYDSTGATKLAYKDNSYSSWLKANGKVYLAVGAAGGSTANLTYSNIKVTVNGTSHTINKIADIPDKTALSLEKTSAEVEKDGSAEISYTALNSSGESVEPTVSSSNENVATVTVADGKIKISGIAGGTAVITVKNGTLSETVSVTVNGFNDSDSYELVGVYPANGATSAYEDGEFMLMFDSAPTLNAGFAIKIFNADGTEADSIAFADETQTLFNVEFGVEDQLVRVEGNSVYFTPHVGKIENEKTYYVSIPSGAITGKMNGSDFTGLTNNKDNTKWKFTTRSAPSVGSTITVNGAQNSTANFRTIQGALNAIGTNSGSYKIEVATGIYRELLYFNGSADVEIEGQGNQTFGKDVEVRFANAGALNDNKNNNEKYRCLFEFIGGNLILEKIYFNNTFLRTNTTALSGKTYTANTQGEALGFDSGKGKWIAAYNCGFYGHQDTIRTIGKGWFYGCYITGDVDFIWQESNGLVQLVEKSTIVALGDDTTKAYLVAPGAAPSSPVGKGSVILNSTVDVQCAETYYGRSPWNSGRYNNAAIVNTTFATSGSGVLKPDYSNTSCSDSIDDKYVGWKTYGNTLPSGITDDTTNHVALEQSFYEQEYSGRRAILNRVYTSDDGKFVKDTTYNWAIDDLIAAQSWTVDADSSSETAAGEAVATGAKGTYDFGDVASTSTSYTSSDTFVSTNAAGTHGTNEAGHGLKVVANNTITIKVSGMAKVDVLGCAYGNGAAFTAKVGDTTLATVSTCKVSTDGEIGATFYYTTNAAADIVITFTGAGFVHGVKVTNLESFTPVSSIAITAANDATSLDVGYTLQLTATPNSDATNQSVTWSSSNTDYATVSSTGLVTGVAAGNVTITATAADGSGVTRTIELTITEGSGETVYAEAGEYNFASNYTALSAYTLIANGFAMNGGESHSYGWVIKNSGYLEVNVSGNCTITFTGSVYSAGNITAEDENSIGTINPASRSCVVETDRTGTYSFTYTGEATTLKFGCETSSTQAYTPSVTITYN